MGGMSQASFEVAGTVRHFAANSLPSGWLKANGAAVSRAGYPALFAAIATTYGVGDGATTFNLPDLRGEFLRGFDDARGVDAARVFGSAQAAEVAGVVGAAVGGCTGGGNVIPAGVTSGTETRPRNIAMLACIKY